MKQLENFLSHDELAHNVFFFGGGGGGFRVLKLKPFEIYLLEQFRKETFFACFFGI